MTTATSQPRTFRPRELAFLIGVPLLWAGLLLFHPGGDGTQVYLDLRDNVTAWMVVHLGMLIFIPLMALATYLLLRGVPGTAARISRIALVPFVVFYSAFETLMGIGNGILANAVNGLPQAERATGARLIQDFTEHPLVREFGVLVSLGSVAFVTAAIAAGVALYRNAGAPLAVPVLLGLAGFLITAHPPPYGPAGLVLFALAVVVFWRSQSAGQAASPLGQPTPA